MSQFLGVLAGLFGLFGENIMLAVSGFTASISAALGLSAFSGKILFIISVATGLYGTFHNDRRNIAVPLIATAYIAEFIKY